MASLYDGVQLVADLRVEVLLPRLHAVPLSGEAAVRVPRRPQELLCLEDEAGPEVVARLGVVVQGGDAARLETRGRVWGTIQWNVLSLSLGAVISGARQLSFC